VSHGSVEHLLHELSATGVRYIVVGGVAVVLHGYLRLTADLDLVIDLESGNVTKALDVFSAFGLRPRPPVPLHSFKDPALRAQWREEKHLQVFSLWHPSGLEVDLFIEDPFPFAEAYERARRLSIDDREVRIASIDDLIAMKRVAGRPKDEEDIRALEALRKTDEHRET